MQRPYAGRHLQTQSFNVRHGLRGVESTPRGSGFGSRKTSHIKQDRVSLLYCCLQKLPMRSFFSRLILLSKNYRNSTTFKQKFHSSPIMSSSTTAAALYAASVSIPSIAGTRPENSSDKKHHQKNGKGFLNPWDSWHEQSAPQIIWAMAKYKRFLSAAGVLANTAQETTDR